MMTGTPFDTLHELKLSRFAAIDADAGLDGWQLAGALVACSGWTRSHR